MGLVARPLHPTCRCLCNRCRPWQADVSDAGVATLAALTQLESLHLGGGACNLGEQSCAAFARRLRGLTALHITDCPALCDSGLFRLAPLAPGLRRLGLSGCGGVTDIALAAVLRAAGRQAAGLGGVQGVGLFAVPTAWHARSPCSTACSVMHLGCSHRRLTHLELAGCHRNITGAGLQVWVWGVWVYNVGPGPHTRCPGCRLRSWFWLLGS